MPGERRKVPDGKAAVEGEWVNEDARSREVGKEMVKGKWSMETPEAKEVVRHWLKMREMSTHTTTTPLRPHLVFSLHLAFSLHLTFYHSPTTPHSIQQGHLGLKSQHHGKV